VEEGRRGDISVFRQLSSSVTCVRGRGRGRRRGGERGRSIILQGGICICSMKHGGFLIEIDIF
jgi:hypothetical protein